MSQTGTKSMWGMIVWGIVGLAILGGVVLFMLLLIGTFVPKVGPEAAEKIAPPGQTLDEMLAQGWTVVPVRQVQVEMSESAVGTIKAVHETAAASKIMARVEAVTVTAGQRVRQGEVLVELDDQEYQARKEQAVAAVSAARAAFEQAEIELNRVRQLHERHAASQIELDRTQADYKAAEAELARAREQLKEAQTILEYTTIRSPIDGIVVDKRVEPGDTVKPGQVVVNLYNPDRMQLIARVRESLAHRLRVGQEVPVAVEALSLKCHGTVSEIVPEAETASRSFSVKVTGPCPDGVYAGMFGRLMIPLDEQAVIVIPASAVEQIGQLSMVWVVKEDRVYRQTVELGRTLEMGVEVLSGLDPGQRILARASLGHIGDKGSDHAGDKGGDDE